MTIQRKERTFRREMLDFPENGLFYPTSILTQIASSTSGWGSEYKRLARSELLARFIFAKDRLSSDEARDVLVSYYGNGDLQLLLQLCLKCEIDGKRDVERLFARIGAELKGRTLGDFAIIQQTLARYLTADGFIPVFTSDSAYLLPFSFEVRQSGDKARVADMRGTDLPEWSGYLAELSEIDKDVRLKVTVSRSDEMTGDSLMLPLMMAWWRQEGLSSFPPYSIPRVYATGSLHGGSLGPVATEEKRRKINASVADSLLICPVAGTARTKGELPIGLRIEACKERIAAWMEERTVCNADYAEKRLKDFDRAVRTLKGQDWESVLNRLKNVWEDVDGEDQPDAYLLGLMLRSSAACHAGRTKEARHYIEKAREFASGKLEFAIEVARLSVAELVIRQDEEDFNDLAKMADAVQDDIDRAAQAEKNDASRRIRDLRMRLNGSLSQIECAAVLAGIQGFTAAQAKEHVDEAFKLAQGLCKDVDLSEEDRFIALCNEAQDANYRVMWAAFFDFDSLEAQAVLALKKANRLEGFNCENESVGSTASVTNAGYRERFRLMGWYRELLKGRRVDGFNPPETELLTDERVEFWARALIGKYLGALEAARGNWQAAKAKFDLGEKLLAGCKEGVLGVIHATICAEAFRSLSGSSDCEIVQHADEMRKNAVKLFESESVLTLGRADWLAWLKNPAEGHFPGLQYWY